jgi:hypothetical protein
VYYNEIHDSHCATFKSLFSKIWKTMILDVNQHSSGILSKPICCIIS